MAIILDSDIRNVDRSNNVTFVIFLEICLIHYFSVTMTTTRSQITGCPYRYLIYFFECYYYFFVFFLTDSAVARFRT